jgi:hypothetical protein
MNIRGGQLTKTKSLGKAAIDFKGFLLVEAAEVYG